jgi:hypothetical protein
MSVAEYGAPTVAVGNDELVIETGPVAGLMTIERALVSVLGVGVVESVTVTPTSVVATVVGVPEMVPVDGLRLSPAGSVPDDQV